MSLVLEKNLKSLRVTRPTDRAFAALLWAVAGDPPSSPERQEEVIQAFVWVLQQAPEALQQFASIWQLMEDADCLPDDDTNLGGFDLPSHALDYAAMVDRLLREDDWQWAWELLDPQRDGTVPYANLLALCQTRSTLDGPDQERWSALHQRLQQEAALELYVSECRDAEYRARMSDAMPGARSLPTPNRDR